MVLYASTPDLLAQQQLQYDQLYGAAGARNASAVTDVAGQNVRTILAQRELDRRDRQFNADAQQRADQFAANLAYGREQGDLSRKSELDYRSTNDAARQGQYEESILREAAKLAEVGQLSPSSVDLYRKALSPSNQARLADIIRNSSTTFNNSQRAAVQPYVDQRASEQAFADRGNSIAAALALKQPQPVISNVIEPNSWRDVATRVFNPVAGLARFAGRLVTPESPTILPDTSGLKSRLAAITAMTAGKNPQIQIMPDQSFGPVTTVPTIQPSILAASAPIPTPAPVIQTSGPNPVDIAYLTRNRNDPRILHLFESRFGAGSSARYLNQQN